MSHRRDVILFLYLPLQCVHIVLQGEVQAHLYNGLALQLEDVGVAFFLYLCERLLHTLT